MKTSVLHEQTATEALSTNLYYELDAERYPSLGNEFFTVLREKYPRAFQRTVPRVVGQSSSSCKSSTSSGDSKSVWSLWECNGDYDKAVVKEAGGMLIPRSDLSVDERLRRNCDSFSSAKTTGDDLLVTLRNFRTALLADSKSFFPSRVVGDVGSSYTSDNSNRDSSHGCRDTNSNQSASDSVSRNSSCDTKSSQYMPQDDTVMSSETVGMSSVQTADCELQPGTNDTVSQVNGTQTISNAEHDIQQMQSVDRLVSTAAINSTADDMNQLLCSDILEDSSRDIALPVESSQADADQRLVESACLNVCVCFRNNYCCCFHASSIWVNLFT